MTITEQYPPTGERPLITYSFINFAEGTGIIDFNCFIAENDSGETEHMQSQTVYSSKIESTISVNDAGFTNIIEKNFDLSPFSNPVTIRGTATVNIPFMLRATNTGNRSAYIIAKIIKVINTVEDILVSTQSQTITIINTVDDFNIFNLRLVVPKTLFQIGSTLRLSIEVWGRKNSGNAGEAQLAHDPKNRDASSIIPSSNAEQTTRLNAFIPFEAER